MEGIFCRALGVKRIVIEPANGRVGVQTGHKVGGDAGSGDGTLAGGVGWYSGFFGNIKHHLPHDIFTASNYLKKSYIFYSLSFYNLHTSSTFHTLLFQ